MALARVQYTQTSAGNRNFTVPMPYISRDDILVSVDGVDVSFSWLNESAVQLDTAPAEGSVIDVRRETTRDELLVDFQDASTITEEQLDLSAKQAFYIAQEAFDATGGTMAVANDGSYSANNRRISNVGDPDSDDDVANVRWVKAQYNSGYDAHTERTLAETARAGAEAAETNAANSEANALSYRNTANSHRLAAQASETAAANSEANAATSETNAANSAAAAKASEDDVAANAAAAASSEANALTYRNNAQASASSASSNATSAANSSAKASQWAELPEDTAVEPGKYSAKHHAAKASASASASALSATTAAGYRDTANSHRQAAANSAAEAASSASAAAASESNAATSETNAANSAAEAAGYASSLNLPNAQGNGNKVLAQKSDESGLTYIAQGSGGGLDADTVDGIQGASILRKDAMNYLEGDSGIHFPSNPGLANSDFPTYGGGIFGGNGDGATSTTANLKIGSWYGVGFAPTISGQAVPRGENAIYMDVRNGDMACRGNFYAEQNKKVFHAGNRQKPTRELLFSGRQGSGHLILSAPWVNYDYIVFLGGADDGDWMTTHTVTKEDLLNATVSDTNDYLVNIRSYWRLRISNDHTNFYVSAEDALMFRIYGGYF